MDYGLVIRTERLIDAIALTPRGILGESDLAISGNPYRELVTIELWRLLTCSSINQKEFQIRGPVYEQSEWQSMGPHPEVTFTVAATLAFHSHFADQNAMAHFLKNISITGGPLQIAAFGAGTFSIDAVLQSHVA